ncbi:unnamed protein product [Didymodactylos carnosus]|uniref:F-box domain-containing protein n=1 Tax=Didymodactylos carnosus TaxID=1234261 RepID=A0A814C1C5_9BILA|nr:unnamed protein product [Didymodactylos carnosus]CAF0935463.1 unnamed protein product [Didymodactylos carnosus]CAF3535721.1 unnamed protein product [Didymodactylos carnosus]CAF3712763.1 unnamed protein product [Didymodactylos carnosus]
MCSTISSPNPSVLPTFTCENTTGECQILATDISLCPKSPTKRPCRDQTELVVNKTKRLCNSTRTSFSELIVDESKHQNFDNFSQQQITISTPSPSPSPTPSSKKPSSSILEWIAQFNQMTSDDRTSAIDLFIQNCSSDTSQLKYLRNKIEPYFQRDFIQDLPRELALQVLRYLPASDLSRASRTCRVWNEIINDVLLWKRLCQSQQIQYKDKPCIFDNLILNPWKRSYACYQHLKHTWNKGQLPRSKYFRGHEDFVITCLQFDGKRIVSGSDDNTLKIWSVETGECEKTLTGHNGGVWCSEMTNDLVVSGSTDRTIRVWNAETGECKHVLYGHTSTVRCLALYKDLVVSGSRDATVRIWNIVTGERLHTLSGHTAAVRCVCYNGKYVVSGAYDHTIRIWIPENERLVHVLEGHTNRVYSLVFDGKHVVSGSLDCSIRVWDVESGTCLHHLTGHLSLTSGMQLRGNILVSGNADSTVKIWNIDSGKCLHTLSGRNKHLSAVTWVQVILNYVVSSGDDGTVKIWDLETGDFIRNLVELESAGSGGVVWRIKCTNSALVCAAGSRNSTEDTKVILLDFDRTTSLNNDENSNSNTSSLSTMNSTSNINPLHKTDCNLDDEMSVATNHSASCSPSIS